MYDTLNEYVYHMVLSFTLGWRDSLTKMNSSFQWNYEQNQLRNQMNE